nr:MAG TPA: helix-turn-helix domain protein [Caudoviricetes sp.]
MTTTIHKNYGCLAAEKRCVYTHKVPAETAVTYDRLVVETPDGWDAYETPAEDIVLTPPDGIPSLLREILCGDEYIPACSASPRTAPAIRSASASWEVNAMPDQPSPIRAARIAAGMTQQQLADALGIAQQSVARWETGEREPRISTLRRIAAVLGCNVTALL